ncbi:chemotaxis protein CheW [Trinickia caryophylli]|uniref:Purine-binding chemotaxis protein CheW n=1 Tax=Trinickia caryophylli TaxID=28094 RepID=A0A1X7GE98_TRICW|nr:chemotaxis protein CheW [Trinickia caryophylli]PMS10774.1 chemotaxis protein CheW [Trinickia caryophylli]TRX13849.1 chemotaxis protein CheW [Trinickia caryophylli]WQE15441.1 chemotaxis protein CheW [Trinickia caryophylli]SMF68404.1 purine-binding chemotaxis protein CheW [Trinickia caryophylli]GLU33821.1 chemotaxis protein CheW [Trinickia caryophylli]
MNPTPASSGSRALIATPAANAAEPAQVLTFMLAGEAYGIGILSIKEIISYTALTTVPMMPAFARGVINLRGAVVPVMDLLSRFGKPSSEVTRRTCIVIVEIQVQGERQDIGIVVDAVNEVLDIPTSEIEPPPAFGSHIRADFIRGMGKVRGRFVILLALEHVLSTHDIVALQSAADASH